MEKIAFQIDPLEVLKPETDSSLMLIAESIRRGYLTYIFQPHNLFYENGKVLARVTKFAENRNENLEIHDLSEFKIIFIRQDPPFDMQYITTTYLLEKIADRVMVINNPASIRDNPEKLFCLDFKDFIPRTCITSDLQIAHEFIKNTGESVIKPLYAHGGNDVYKVNEHILDEKFKHIMNKYQDKLIIQEFIPQVKDGDKRVLMVNGEVAATLLRVPQDGCFVANLAQGGTPHKTELTAREQELCHQVGIKLKEKGLVFAGIDIINGYLIEINITSPTCIIPANSLYGIKVEQLIFNMLV